MAAQLTEAVTGKLKTSYTEPAQVTVIVNQSKSYALDVLGDVHAQGKHVVRLGTTFLQAVSLAGGFVAFASTRKITLRHRGSACKETFIPMFYKVVLAGQQANLVSKPVDTIIVPYRSYTLPNTDPHSSIKATEEYNAYERIAMACEDGER